MATSCTGITYFKISPEPSYVCMGFKSSLPSKSFPSRPPSTFQSLCVGYSVYREDQPGLEGGVCGVGMQFIVGRKGIDGGAGSKTADASSSSSPPKNPTGDTPIVRRPTSSLSAPQPTSLNLNLSTLSSTAKRHSNFAQKVFSEVRNTVQDNYEQRCKEFGGKVIARVPRTARDIYKYSTGGGQK